jgi:hypothetical protein
MEKGAETGGQMVTGTVADFWKLKEDPIEYFEVRPATTIMMVAPVLAELRGMAAAKYGPAWKGFANPKVQAAADFIDQAAQKITKSKAKPLQASKRFLESTGRLLKDPTIQATERATKFVDQLMNEVKRTGDSIGTIADRYVQSIKQGNIETPGKKEAKFGGPLKIAKRGTIEGIVPVTKREDLNQRIADIEKKELETRAPDLSDSKISTPSDVVKDTENINFYSSEDVLEDLAELPEDVLDLTPPPDTDLFVPLQERLKRIGIDIDKRIEEGLPAAYMDDYDYLPESKSIGSSTKEALQLRAEGLDLEKPGDWEKFITVRNSDPIYIRRGRARLTDTVNQFIDDISLIKGVIPEEAKKQFVKNFSGVTIGTLKSDIVRAEVVKKARQELSNIYSGSQLDQATKAFENFVNDIIKRNPQDPKYNHNAVINFGREPEFNAAGEIIDYTNPKKTLDLAKMAYDAITENSANQTLIDAQLLQRTAEDIATMAKREKTSQVLTRDLGKAGTINDWVVENLADIMAGEEMPPAIPINAKKIAEFLTETADTVAEKFGVKPAQVLETAEKIAQYERMSPDIAEHFGLTRYLAKERGGPVEVYAPPGVNSTLKFEMDAYKAVYEAKDMWHKINSAIKGNITARNIASAINNITGNFSYQTFRRGEPLLASNLLEVITKYSAYRQGATIGAGKGSPFRLSPQEKAFFESMERTGYLDVDLTDIELGGIGAAKQVPFVPKKFNALLDKFYKSGDTIFKLEDGLRNYKKLSKELKELRDGDWVDLDLNGKGRWTRLTKKPNGFSLEGKLLTSRELSDVLAKASAQPGRKIFVDYQDVPNMVKFIRATKALGITSPFFSWGWQVMDIPLPIVGKKGLGAYALTDSVPYRTNNIKLNGIKVVKAAARSARRQTMLAAMREAVLAEDDETLRKVLSFAPKDFNLQLLEELGSPFTIGYDSMESANQFAPSDAIVRGIMDFQSVDNDELMELYKMTEDGKSNIDFMLETVDDPETKLDILKRRKLIKKRLSGEGFESGDLLSLIGLSGTPIMDVVVMMQQADRVGKTIDYRKLYQSGATALLGGTSARALEIGLEGLVETDIVPENVEEGIRSYTTRRWALDPLDKKSEDFIRWSMRRMTGLGFRPMDIGERSEYYWSNKAKEWKSTLTKALKERVEDPEVPLTGQQREDLNQRILDIEKIVDGEIMLEKLHFQKVLQKLSKPKKR